MVRRLGKEKLVIVVMPLKALSPTLTSAEEEANVTTSAVRPLKAEVPILVTDAGIVILVNAVRGTNTLGPMAVTSSGIITLVFVG